MRWPTHQCMVDKRRVPCPGDLDWMPLVLVLVSWSLVVEAGFCFFTLWELKRRCFLF